MDCYEANKFDLHMHSVCSDGADTPATVVEKAERAGLKLMALTDHDTTAGIDEALHAGCERGIRVLPAAEIDTEWPGELHILGLDLDIANSEFHALLTRAQARRMERNAGILARLKRAGYDASPYLDDTGGNVTRLHIALALVKGGYANDAKDAFKRFLGRGCVGHYLLPRPTPEEVVSAILAAGGVPVWAHPFHGGDNVHKTLEVLLGAGIRGVEAYHPSASAGQSEILVSLARQNGLLVTCGSDSHGANRPEAPIGCTWRDTPELRETYAYLTQRTAR